MDSSTRDQIKSDSAAAITEETKSEMGEKKAADDYVTKLPSPTSPPPPKYEGALVNGKRHGPGKELYSNGNWYEGVWENGEKVGQGTLFYKNGRRITVNNFKSKERCRVDFLQFVYLINHDEYW